MDACHRLGQRCMRACIHERARAGFGIFATQPLFFTHPSARQQNSVLQPLVANRERTISLDYSASSHEILTWAFAFSNPEVLL